MLASKEQSIPCPVCKTGIPFDTRQLLQGVRFSCPSCGSAIGLADESKGVVQKTLDAFDDAKRTLVGSGTRRTSS